MRNKVSSKRYSILGLPCLYLGTSSYVCWVELGRPNLSTLVGSGFILSDFGIKINIKTINLGYRPCDVLYDVEDDQLVVNYFKIFPMIIACSVQRLNSTAEFHPEYIVSQLLSAYVCQASDIDGISYISTQATKTESRDIVSNYAFFVKSNTFKK
jgi:hypothetical protein